MVSRFERERERADCVFNERSNFLIFFWKRERENKYIKKKKLHKYRDMILKLKQISTKDGQGKVVLIPQVPEDMW